MSSDSDRDPVARRRSFSPVLPAEDFRPLSATVRVEFGACSDGRPRPAHNEDHYLVVRLGRTQETILTSLSDAEVPQRFGEHGYAMIVADGLGGEGAGGMASRIAVTTLAHLVLHYGRWNLRVDSRTAFEIVDRLDWGYNQVDEAVRQRARAHRDLVGMSTKLTAAYSAGDELFVAHAGRSLAYVFRDGNLLHLSSEVASAPKAMRPRLVTDDSENLSGILTDAIGGAGRLIVTIEQYQIRDGDLLLVCTEGLVESLPAEQIADILADRRRPEDTTRRLVDAALDTGKVTNVTAVLASYRIPSQFT